MNLLLLDGIHSEAPMPDFGEAFLARMQQKQHPDVLSSSLCAWNLLARGLDMLNVKHLPEVMFLAGGKPVFRDHPLHFSLSHSGRMAAAVISDMPCGVDLEIIRPEIAHRLRNRVLSEDELQAGCGFFEVWTKKEAAAKLTGSGMPPRPAGMDTAPFDGMNCLHRTIFDSHGSEYCLCVLCADPQPIKIPDMH